MDVAIRTQTQRQEHNLTLDLIKYGIISRDDERLAQSYIFFDQLDNQYPKDLIYKIFGETAQKIINRQLDDKFAYFKVAFEKNIEKAVLTYVAPKVHDNYFNQQILGLDGYGEYGQSEPIAITEVESHQVRFARSTMAEYFLIYANVGKFLPYPDEEVEIYNRLTKQNGERGRKGKDVDFEEVSDEEFNAWESRMRIYGYGNHLDQTWKRRLINENKRINRSS